MVFCKAYLLKKEGKMNISIKKEFADDFVTREAGEKLRKLIIKGLEKKEKVTVDFTDSLIASTSFFDEGLAKLAQEKINFSQIRNDLSVTGLHRRDRELLESLCERRQINIPIN
jgi:hypothetical protein